MRALLSLFISSLLAATTLVAISSPQASAAPTLTTCTNLETGKTLVLRSADAQCRSHLGSALWVQEQSDSAARTGDGYATITVCSSKNLLSTYRLIKDSCPKFQLSTNYWRTVAPPATPVIQAASARGHDSAALFITPSTSALTAPVLYYLVTDTKSGLTSKVMPGNLGQLLLSNLSSLTSYTFTIAAVSVDGTSLSSSITPVITTGAAPVVASTAAPLAAPAFTLSSASETKTVNTAATGFTINSTGGAIASFAISATPAGMSFSTSTGALTGTPTSIASATAYTITATNASGTATQTFTLTVTVSCATGGTCIVGDRGPGGGIVYYVSAAPFTSAGSTCNTACKYLEVAPAGWNNGGVVAIDPRLNWSTDLVTVTGQDRTTTSSEGFSESETVNWKIGQGFYNTSVMMVAGATSNAQAAVLAYAGTSIAGQWFIPSMNELNELCKYARGQATGDLTVACTSSGTLKDGTANDLGGFFSSNYWSSSERIAANAWLQTFLDGAQGFGGKQFSTRYVRPVRAF